MIAEIENRLARLRDSERKVAIFVLDRPNLVARSSIRYVAEGAAVSEPTVIRFCRAVGCRGFQDLKEKLARDLGRMTAPMAMLAPSTGEVGVSCAHALRGGIEALYTVRAALPSQDFAAAGQAMVKAPRVALAARRRLAGLAQQARHDLASAGLPTDWIAIDPPEPTPIVGIGEIGLVIDDGETLDEEFRDWVNASHTAGGRIAWIGPAPAPPGCAWILLAAAAPIDPHLDQLRGRVCVAAGLAMLLLAVRLGATSRPP